MPDNAMNILKGAGVITMIIGSWLALIGLLGFVVGGILLAIFGFLIYLFAAVKNNSK